MKRQWDTLELVEQFTLEPSEMVLLENKSEENRLGFAVLLKFFQMEARFPRSKQEVPKKDTLTAIKDITLWERSCSSMVSSIRTGKI